MISLIPGDRLKIWFPINKREVRETIGRKDYVVKWVNGTVIDIKPDAQYHALYPVHKADSD